MKIEPYEFNEGAQFIIRASTEAERVLLIACVDQDTLRYEGEENEFLLTLKVSND